MSRLQVGSSVLDFMGNTPLVRLSRLTSVDWADVFVKLEEFNPGGSIKSRVASRMISDAEANGRLRPGQTLIEPTGGNTGIGLAMVAAVKGYRVVLVVPDNFSKEKIRTLRAFGAKVILSDSSLGNDSHVQKVREIIAEDRGYIWLNQFENLGNPAAHHDTTADEIIAALPAIDCFVAGVGSGGTLTGVGRRIKASYPRAQVIAVQPEGCDVLKGKAVRHPILALALGFLPGVLDVSVADSAESVSKSEVYRTMVLLARREGLLVGLSSAANVAVSLRVAERLGAGKTVVTVAPDSGRSYLDDFDEAVEMFEPVDGVTHDDNSETVLS